MKASRELDAVIAEKVMKYAKPIETPEGLGWHEIVNYLHPTVRFNLCPRYSTDIAAAWEVVEKMSGYAIHLERFMNHWRCDFGIIMAAVASGEKGFGQGRAETAPHAICLAALKAIGA